MRYIFLLVVVIIVTISCNLKKEKQEIYKCNDDFNVFLKRFGSDSAFQKRHVKFPLRWLYYEDLESNTPTIEMRNLKSYRFFSFTDDKTAEKREYGAFEISKKITNDTLIYTRSGLDNGLHINFKFKLIDNCWYLVEIVDESS